VNLTDKETLTLTFFCYLSKLAAIHYVSFVTAWIGYLHSIPHIPLCNKK